MKQTETAVEDPARTKPAVWKRLIQALVSTVVVVGIFVGVMPQIADYSDVWEIIRSLTGLEATTLALVAFWNLATYWFVLVAALPGLRLREAAVVNQASTAVSNSLPGGGAIGVGVTLAMLTSWGFRVAAIARSALVTGIWNNFVKLGMPVLALALLALESDVTPARVASAAVGLSVLAGSIALFGLILRSDRLARSIGKAIGSLVSGLRRLVRRSPVVGWDTRAAGFRSDTIGLLQHRWLQLTLASLLSHLSLYVVLLVSLRHIGVGQQDLSWIQVLAAFAFVRLISALPVTPGGVGIVELGYAAAMTIGMDAQTSAEVVAAILVFRVITYALPIPLGAVTYVIWRRNQSWRMAEPQRDLLAIGSDESAATA
ncbi:MAG: YbhN family protein [Acidimicrobiia bacterium]|nr:YbhN family protein [Acidimicrobiia bacterium]